MVLAADTQETYPAAKVRGDKILTLTSERPASRGVVSITGAGDSDYVDKFAQNVMRTFLDHRRGSLETAFEKTLVDFFKQHVLPFGLNWATEMSYSISTIIAFQRDGETKLLASGGVALKDASPYVARGTGETVARTILRDLYRDGLSREAAMRLAAYAIYRAKEADPNSGNQTEVLLLSGGKTRQIPDRTVKQWEGVFDRIDRVTAKAARRMLDVTRDTSNIGDADLGEIERTFVHSSHQWPDHPLPIPKPVSPEARRVRQGSKRDR